MAVQAGPDHSETLHVLRVINQAEGRALRLVRRLPGGFQEGAYEVREGRERLVLKWHTRDTPLERLVETAEIVDAARDAGWPTPAWRLVGITDTGVRYVVTDFVEGVHPEVLTPSILDELLRVNELQTALAPATEQEWSRYALETVFHDRDQMFSAVAASSAEGRDLERAIVAACSGGESAPLPDQDLVSGVFALENILFRDGHVAGVIDVGAIGRGSRVFDLSVLYARVGTYDDLVEQRLRSAAEQVAGPLLFRVTLAAEVIGLLFFGTRHWPEHVPTACAAWAARFNRLATV